MIGKIKMSYIAELIIYYIDALEKATSRSEKRFIKKCIKKLSK